MARAEQRSLSDVCADITACIEAVDTLDAAYAALQQRIRDVDARLFALLLPKSESTRPDASASTSDVDIDRPGA